LRAADNAAAHQRFDELREKSNDIYSHRLAHDFNA
jgi:hypothetical protein